MFWTSLKEGKVLEGSLSRLSLADPPLKYFRGTATKFVVKSSKIDKQVRGRNITHMQQPRLQQR